MNDTQQKFDLKEITKKVSKYGLVPGIMQQLEKIRQKPIARSTVYRAFDLGPTTDTQELVLEVAQQKIEERELLIATSEA